MVEAILAEVAQNEPHAMDRCRARYERLVWKLAERVCRDREAAEAAVQSIFTEIKRCAGEFGSTRETELGFVSTVARRCLAGGACCQKCAEEVRPATQAAAERRASAALNLSAETAFMPVDVGGAICPVGPRVRRGLMSLRALLAKAQGGSQTAAE